MSAFHDMFTSIGRPTVESVHGESVRVRLFDLVGGPTVETATAVVYREEPGDTFTTDAPGEGYKVRIGKASLTFAPTPQSEVEIDGTWRRVVDVVDLVDGWELFCVQ